MSVKKSVSVTLILLLLILMIGNIDAMAPNDTINQEPPFIPSQYVEHDPIIIRSDTDFVEQGLPGNGTEEEPYLIEGILINDEIDSLSIGILNTRMFVEVRDCKIQKDLSLLICQGHYPRHQSPYRAFYNF